VHGTLYASNEAYSAEEAGAGISLCTFLEEVPMKKNLKRVLGMLAVGLVGMAW
jgi:hypothetical protein